MLGIVKTSIIETIRSEACIVRITVGTNMFVTINNFEKYSINSQGVILNSKGRKIKPQKNRDGYMTVNLWDGKKYHHKRRCRLVAEHFVKGYKEGLVVNHKNGIKDDDRCSNLEWVTVKENTLHGLSYTDNFDRKSSDLDLHQVHKICDLLSKGFRTKDIAEYLEVSQNSCLRISNRESWKEVSRYYTFPPRKNRLSKNTAKWVLGSHYSGKSVEEILESSKNKTLTQEIIELILSNKIFKDITRTFND